MFLTSNFYSSTPITYSSLIPKACFSETFLKYHSSDPSGDLAINMIENKLHELYKWWPASTTYSENE
jgi:hypothetical protein